MPVNAPMERVAVDIFGPLPLTKANNKYVLVVTDLFTKWTEAIALPNQEADTVSKAFVDNFVSRFGVPLQLHSDRGSNFTSKLFSDMCDLLQIDHTMSTPQHPQSNGSVERFNRTLASILTMYCDKNQRNWDLYLPQVMMAYRSSIHSSIGKTPNQMLFGHDIILPFQAGFDLPPPVQPQVEGSIPETYVQSLQQQLEHIHTVARKCLKSKACYRKRHYDLYAKHRSLHVGDSVWVHNSSRKLGICKKLSPQWQGPFLVTKKIDDLVYMIKQTLHSSPKAIHIDRLQKYKGQNIPKWFNKALQTCKKSKQV